MKLLNMTGYSKPSNDYDFNSLVIYDSDFDVLKKYKCPAAACGKRFFDPQSLRTHGLASGGTHRQVDYLTQLGAALVTKDTGRADGRRACPVRPGRPLEHSCCCPCPPPLSRRLDTAQ